jgi:hypothetical protein
MQDVRCVGYLIYNLIAGESPWQSRIGKRLQEATQSGYVSFTNPLWKRVSPEALQFVKRLIRPIESSDKYEDLLQDRFIKLN